ncbi:MAG: hypothetical protein IJX97_06065 [Clostridia bacterium]|nr:hypothetical protein [Clostridia bacterium]
MGNAKIGLEIERKYIIKMPDVSVLSQQPEYTVSSILQIYLQGAIGETHRVRRRDFDDRVVCTETRKIRIDKISSTEIEGEIGIEEFDRLAASILKGTQPINKVRHTFLYEGQTFEIDVYPRWKNTAIMETELDAPSREVKIPSFINIVREVTGNKAYSNAGMSRQFPKEDI